MEERMADTLGLAKMLLADAESDLAEAIQLIKDRNGGNPDSYAMVKKLKAEVLRRTREVVKLEKEQKEK